MVVFRESRASSSASAPFWTLFKKTRVLETIYAKQRANVRALLCNVVSEPMHLNGVSLMHGHR